MCRGWGFITCNVFMRYLIAASLLLFALAVCAAAQKKHVPGASPVIPASVPVQKVIKTGRVNGNTYTDPVFEFEITFPDIWHIAGDDFEKELKKHGIDLSLKAPDALPISARTKVDRAVKNVEILFTAYRATTGSTEMAIVRASAEDLSGQPQIKDAVDYFDAVRATYESLKLPAPAGGKTRNSSIRLPGRDEPVGPKKDVCDGQT
jgi:hypothetical protein